MTTYIVLGGCGFIGRNVVEYLKKEEVATKIRVVDKKMAAMSNMSEAHEEMFDDEKIVEFVQADVSRDNMIQKAFAGKFDFVINCAGDNELGLDDKVYEERVVAVTQKCAAAALKMGAKFIQVSDARIYKPSSKPCDEKATAKPWTKLASAHQKAEQLLQAMQGLNYVILRPSVVYGPGDISSLMPRCVLGAIYKQSKEVMKMPFSGKVILSTVHVRDVAQACYAAAVKGKSGEIYNVADPGNITLGEINQLIESVFQIKTDFISGAMNLMLKGATNAAAEMVNDKHMKPWGDLCKSQGIDSPVLSPFLSPETLVENDLTIDGSKIKQLEMEYKHQKPTAGLLLEQITYFRKQNQFPK